MGWLVRPCVYETLKLTLPYMLCVHIFPHTHTLRHKQSHTYTHTHINLKCDDITFLKYSFPKILVVKIIGFLRVFTYMYDGLGKGK